MRRLAALALLVACTGAPTEVGNDPSQQPTDSIPTKSDTTSPGPDTVSVPPPDSTPTDTTPTSVIWTVTVTKDTTYSFGPANTFTGYNACTSEGYVKPRVVLIEIDSVSSRGEVRKRTWEVGDGSTAQRQYHDSTEYSIGGLLVESFSIPNSAQTYHLLQVAGVFTKVECDNTPFPWAVTMSIYENRNGRWDIFNKCSQERLDVPIFAGLIFDSVAVPVQRRTTWSYEVGGENYGNYRDSTIIHGTHDSNTSFIIRTEEMFLTSYSASIPTYHTEKRDSVVGEAVIQTSFSEECK